MKLKKLMVFPKKEALKVGDRFYMRYQKESWDYACFGMVPVHDYKWKEIPIIIKFIYEINKEKRVKFYQDSFWGQKFDWPLQDLEESIMYIKNE